MWETICDAQAGFCTLTSNSKFLSKFFRAPFWNFRPESPPPHWNLGRSWALWVFDSRVPPSRKLKFRQILALWVFGSRIPPPPLNEGDRMWRLISVSPVDTISFYWGLQMLISRICKVFPLHITLCLQRTVTRIESISSALRCSILRPKM